LHAGRWRSCRSRRICRPGLDNGYVSMQNTIASLQLRTCFVAVCSHALTPSFLCLPRSLSLSFSLSLARSLARTLSLGNTAAPYRIACIQEAINSGRPISPPAPYMLYNAAVPSRPPPRRRPAPVGPQTVPLPAAVSVSPASRCRHCMRFCRYVLQAQTRRPASLHRQRRLRGVVVFRQQRRLQLLVTPRALCARARIRARAGKQMQTGFLT
jgi:hypothetical protein